MGWLVGDTPAWEAFWNLMSLIAPIGWIWLGYRWGYGRALRDHPTSPSHKAGSRR